MAPWNGPRNDQCLTYVQGDPVEVLPWLFIGSAYHASREDRLSSCGISALLNMADSSSRDDVTTTSGLDRKRLRHVNIAVADSCSSDISCCFPQAIDLIGQHHRLIKCLLDNLRPIRTAFEAVDWLRQQTWLHCRIA